MLFYLVNGFSRKNSKIDCCFCNGWDVIYLIVPG
jgi:hypothetical protein